MKRFLFAIAAAILLPGAASAQGMDEIFAKGVAFLQNRGFDDARNQFDQMIAEAGDKAMQNFGPAFGSVYYHRGLAFMGLGKFAEAASDFETAAMKFPNKPGESRVNPYQTISLLQAGSSMMQTKEPDHAKALEWFKRFETAMQGTPVDRDNVVYNRAAFWGSTAICEAMTEKPRNAAATFDKLAKDPGGADRASRSTFDKTTQLVQGAAIEIVDAFQRSKNPEEGVAFLNTHRTLLREDPGIVYYYAPRYLQIASEATKAKQFDLALGIYALLPNTRQALAGLDTAAHRAEAMPMPNGQPSAYGAMIKQIREKLINDRDSGKAIEVYTLDGNARIYQLSGNYQAVFGVYRTLARQYPKSKLRPEILYYAALSASIIGRLDDTQKYGESFIAEFPNHELKPRVEELMIEGMFWASRYEDALRIAQGVRPKVADGSPGAELCDFVIGGSLYFLGRYATAEPILAKFNEQYPKSKHREMARFYMGDNLARLNKFTEAGTQLDVFLKDYPESGVLDLALYSRANAHYNLDQQDAAINRLNQFVSKRPYSTIRDQANNLFGNVFESQQKPVEAEKSYRKAKEIAEAAGNDSVAAESLVFLMGLLVQDQARTADTVALYDEFFQKYAESPNRAKAAVVALPALEKSNRLPDALKRLEVIIAGFGNNVEAVGLEDCIVSYTNNAEKAGMTLAQLRERMYSFPGLPPDATIAKARLRMALIDVYEKKIKEEKDDTARNQLKGEIDGLFSQLKKDFDPAKMPNYSLVRIGDHLMKSGNARQAKDYFSQVLKNDDVAFRDKAQFNLAVILGETDAQADRDQAIVLLDKLLADFASDRVLSEKVVRQKAIVYELGGQWDKVSETWRAYLKNQGWVKYQTEAHYMLGVSQDKRQLWGDALASYLQVFSLNPGDLLYSSPAWFRFAEIQYKELAKKQEGYEALFRMVRDIGHLEAAEAKGLIEWKAGMDPLTQRRMAERLQTNYIQRAIQTQGAWEGAGGITPLQPVPDKDKTKKKK